MTKTTVAIMAANAKDALDSRSSAGFAAAYSVVRLILVAQYARARTVPAARRLATHYLTGHGSAALLWLASAIVPAPERFAVWAIAFAIDLGTPWLAVRHNVEVPPDASHLPERFGLFTLILLGESVVALMRGIESQENWPAEAAASAFLGMSLLFLGEVRWSAPGVLLALASGSIASGLGYVVWYTALRGLTATRAAVVQLSVPVIAAAGGVLLLSEAVTARLLLASVIVLGGVGLAVAGRTGDSTRKRLPEDG